jgi:hypothetical protein
VAGVVALALVLCDGLIDVEGVEVGVDEEHPATIEVTRTTTNNRKQYFFISLLPFYVIL